MLRIVGLCVLAAVAYGVLHDQVTARLSVEYFTIGHPRLVSSESPAVLGLLWGVLGTWWVGLALGVLLALAATRGAGPRRSAGSLLRPILVLLSCMAVASVVFGLVGYALASGGVVLLLEPLASRVPPARHVAFLAVGWAHGASYVVGLVGGVVLAARVWRSRRRAARAAVAVGAVAGPVDGSAAP